VLRLHPAAATSLSPRIPHPLLLLVLLSHHRTAAACDEGAAADHPHQLRCSHRLQLGSGAARWWDPPHLSGTAV